MREREYEEQTRRTQVEKTRKERKAREAFRAVLRELVDAGVLTARTKWKEVYPRFRDDPRYLAMLGNPGSNPLELFWDAVDALDQQLDAKVRVVEDVIRWHNERLEGRRDGAEDAMDDRPVPFAVAAETTWAEFAEVVNVEADSSVKALSDDELRPGVQDGTRVLLLYMHRADLCLVYVAARRRCEEAGGREEAHRAQAASFTG